MSKNNTTPKTRERKFSKALLGDALEHWLKLDQAEFNFDTGNGTQQLLVRYRKEGWNLEKLIEAAVAFGRADMADRIVDHFEL